MELWLELLFGNPVGLGSVIVVLLTIIIGIFMATMFIRKSKKHDSEKPTH